MNLSTSDGSLKPFSFSIFCILLNSHDFTTFFAFSLLKGWFDFEINLTKLRYLRPNAQIIALSATVGNCEQLSNWLDAELIISNWRPVALEYSTFHDLHLEPRMVQSSNLSDNADLLNPPSCLLYTSPSPRDS